MVIVYCVKDITEILDDADWGPRIFSRYTEGGERIEEDKKGQDLSPHPKLRECSKGYVKIEISDTGTSRSQVFSTKIHRNWNIRSKQKEIISTICSGRKFNF